MKSLLIKDTTKEERERIVYQALWGSCGIDCECSVRRDIPDSTAFVPSVAGLIIAGEVIKDLAGCGNK